MCFLSEPGFLNVCSRLDTVMRRAVGRFRSPATGEELVHPVIYRILDNAFLHPNHDDED